MPRAAGGKTDNLYFASSYLPVPASGGDADMAAFRSAVPDADRTSASQGAFSTVLNLRALLAKLPAPSAATLTTALKATVNEPNVMAHPYTCDGKQIEIFPAVCDTSVRLLHWQDNAFSDVTGDWVDGRQLITLIN